MIYSELLSILSIIIAGTSALLAWISVKKSEKQLSANILIEFAHKESEYVNQYNNANKDNQNDKAIKILNLYELIAIFYFNKTLNQEHTKEYFYEIFRFLLVDSKENLTGTFAYTKNAVKLAKEWNIPITH